MGKTDFTIDLMEGLKDPEKAKDTVKAVQNAIDELVIANGMALDAARKSNDIADKFEAQATTLMQSTIDLTKAIKSVHTLLGSKKDLWEKDEEMKGLMDGLAVFVSGSAAIKLGVVGNASNK